MNELIFYHSADLDGHCSGAIVKMARPDAKLIGIDYGEDFPWDMVNSDTKVYMVDFSLQPAEDMIRLNEVSDLIWIDHHKSAIEANPTTIAGQRHNKFATCELCWQYFFSTKETPRTVYLLGRYDVWDKDHPEWQSEILPFQYGFRDHFDNTDPKSGKELSWEALLTVNDPLFVTDIILKGKHVLRKAAVSNKQCVERLAYPVKFEGLNAIACNKGLTNSRLFDSVWNEIKHDIMITYVHVRGKYWTVSLYSTKPDVDVSVIAKKYGGGGHKGAAGFQCQELPFKRDTP